MKNKKENKETEKRKRNDAEALFIPAGVLTGMGFGFLYGNLVAGLFLGLGIGFVIFALLSTIKSFKK